MTSILYQFNKSLNFLSKLELIISSKNIPNLFIKKEFDKFIENYFHQLIDEKFCKKCTDLLFKNNSLYPEFEEHLKALTKAVIDALPADVIGSHGYDQKLQRLIQSSSAHSEGERLRHIYDLLIEILRNEDYKARIKEQLWENYFDTQKNIDLTSSKKINESINGYFYQVQADPLKRAFYIAFTSLFNYINHEIYRSSNGEKKIDYGIEDTDEPQKENPLARYYRHLRGVSFP